MRNVMLVFSVAFIITLIGCKKQENSNPQQNSSVYANELLKDYQGAANYDALLVNYYQHYGSGNHDSIHNYEHLFTWCDSLFSLNFYQYCRDLYVSNGGHMYGGMGMGGGMQCGLDTLQYMGWNGSGNFMQHDSLMYGRMEVYNMLRYFSPMVGQTFSEMQSLRYTHYTYHNYP